jgi:hypothetical protein
VRIIRAVRGKGLICFILALGAPTALGRVVPVAPVTSWPVIPAVQGRSARHAVVLELVSYGAACYGCDLPFLTRVVVHDSLGMEAPWDVTPGKTPGNLRVVAALEGTDGTLRLLLYGFVDATGRASPSGNILYSADGGTTWTVVALPAGSQLNGVAFPWTDIGGPVSYGIGSPIRLGTTAVPFVVSVQDSNSGGIWGIRADGSAYLLTPPDLAGTLLGSDIGGTRFLVMLYAAPPANRGVSPWKVSILDLSGNVQQLFEPFPSIPSMVPWMEGWITPDGRAYIDVDWSWRGSFAYPNPGLQPFPSGRSVLLWQQGVAQEIVSTNTGTVFGVPSADFSGAWIVSQQTYDSPTVLDSHTSAGGLIEAWRDASGPPISAVFAAGSGQRLLLQTDQRGWRTPSLGLTVWNLGEPVPSRYDEIFLKGAGVTFVHLDVDDATRGAPIFIAPGAVGGETQSLVRASLQQQLVIPASARTPGQYGSGWRTDLILRNPGTSPLQITARLLANPALSSLPPDASLTVSPGTIAVIPDALGSLFHLEKGSGALLLIPGSGGTLEATSRTYTVSSKGTYGMAVDAEDVIAAVRPGFSQPFSAGLLGSGFRTNFVAGDVSGLGSQLQLSPTASGGAGTPQSIAVPPNGQAQLNDLAFLTGTPSSQSGSFLATSSSGAAITGLIAADNGTNDPTWFGPDVPPGFLTIPAIVHAGGANGAQYRTDLFAFNPDPVPHSLQMDAWLWNQPDSVQGIHVTLGPGESRRISDALFSLFGWTGVASLRVFNQFQNGGVPVTSRTYAIQADGSTYGMILPPLTASQVAQAGDTLEILGPTGGATFRTNLSLVEIGGPITVHIQILDDNGTLLDAFDESVPAGGGVQINDLFRSRGLGDGPKAALIRLSLSPGPPASGPLAAYATTIDNGTNDPVYFAGNLAP